MQSDNVIHFWPMDCFSIVVANRTHLASHPCVNLLTWSKYDCWGLSIRRRNGQHSWHDKICSSALWIDVLDRETFSKIHSLPPVFGMVDVFVCASPHYFCLAERKAKLERRPSGSFRDEEQTDFFNSYSTKASRFLTTGRLRLAQQQLLPLCEDTWPTRTDSLFSPWFQGLCW